MSVQITSTYHLTPKSRNTKTGPIPVSTSPATTCPAACPLTGGGGCYAAGGPLAIHWQRVTDGLTGATWAAFLAAVRAIPGGQLWRHNQAGDLRGSRGRINRRHLLELARASRHALGFTYTHYPASPKNVGALRDAAKLGFTVNLSANNLAHADQLAETGLPIVTLLPAATTDRTVLTPAGRTVVVCPATYRDDITCGGGRVNGRKTKSCGRLCARQRRFIVGFPAHGASKRKVSEIAKQ
jgi:hypothetical protein